MGVKVKKATKAEISKIKRLAKVASNTPVMAMSSEAALNGRDFATLAWEDVYTAIDRVAIRCGFKKFKQHYGINLETGELIPPK